MKKLYIGFILLSFIFLSSCAPLLIAKAIKNPYTISGVVTGNKYEPLPENIDVKVELLKQSVVFEEVGVVQIVLKNQFAEDDLAKIVEMAKQEARIMGGNIISLKSSQLVKKEVVESSAVYDNEGSVIDHVDHNVIHYNPKYIFVVGKF